MDEELTWDDVPQFMDELRAAARCLLAGERSAQTLTPTGLVLTALRRQKLKDQDFEEVTWANQAYFFGAMHRAMRRALIDHGRAGRTQERRYGRRVPPEQFDLDNIPAMMKEVPEAVVALGVALEELRERDEKLAEVIQLRYFSGLTIDEASRSLGVAEKTVRRWCDQARAMLAADVLRRLAEEEGGAA